MKHLIAQKMVVLRWYDPKFQMEVESNPIGDIEALDWVRRFAAWWPERIVRIEPYEAEPKRRAPRAPLPQIEMFA